MDVPDIQDLNLDFGLDLLCPWVFVCGVWGWLARGRVPASLSAYGRGYATIWTVVPWLRTIWLRPYTRARTVPVTQWGTAGEYVGRISANCHLNRLRFLLTGLAVDAGILPLCYGGVIKRTFLPWLVLDYTFRNGMSRGGLEGNWGDGTDDGAGEQIHRMDRILGIGRIGIAGVEVQWLCTR